MYVCIDSIHVLHMFSLSSGPEVEDVLFRFVRLSGLNSDPHKDFGGEKFGA